EEQAVEAENAVERRAELVTDGGKEARLRLARRLGFLPRFDEGLFDDGAALGETAKMLLAVAELPCGIGQAFVMVAEMAVVGQKPADLAEQPAAVEVNGAGDGEHTGDEGDRSEHRTEARLGE